MSRALFRDALLQKLASQTATLLVQWDFDLTKSQEQLGQRYHLWCQGLIGGAPRPEGDQALYLQEEAIAYGRLIVCNDLWHLYAK